MRKFKQTVCVLLVLVMMFSVMSVGVVQSSAAVDPELYGDYPTPILGDINRDGYVNGLDVYYLKASIAGGIDGYINYNPARPEAVSKDSIEFRIANCYKDDEIFFGQAPSVDGLDAWLIQCYIAGHDAAEGSGIGDPIDVGTADITIYGLNGQSETKTFNVGDTFTVYTSLNASKAFDGGRISSVNATQTYSTSTLSLTTDRDSSGIFTDNAAAFPVLKDSAIGRMTKEGTIKYNASTPYVDDKAFAFDSNDDLLMVTTYQVTNSGTGEVRNALTTLVAADNDLTRLVDNGTVADGVTLTVNATFDKPGSTPEPTKAPTQAPTQKPTEAPTQAPTQKPTEAPTQAPTQKPTEAPTQAPTEAPTTPPTAKATVTLHGLFGQTETREFNVGDTFAVWTYMNTSDCLDENDNPSNGKIGSFRAQQTYTQSVLTLADAYDPEDGMISDRDTMFPITGQATVANGKKTGGIYFNASTPSVSSGAFWFNSDDCVLILSHYTVSAAGDADIETGFTTLAVADGELTRIVDKGIVKQDNFSVNSYFDPYVPSTSPTEAPTQKPTAAPTQAPTQSPTSVPTGTATVTLHGLFGQTETKEFNVGDTFAVWTYMNTKDCLDQNGNVSGGKIGSLRAQQTYTQSVLTLADAYDPADGMISDRDTMFPITGQATVANGKKTGGIYFNASTPSISSGAFWFNSDDSVLIYSHYTVTAAGTADIETNFTTLAVADNELTRIVDKGVIEQDNFTLNSYFGEIKPAPTQAPTQKPTEAPTQAPTEAPTEAPTDPPVTIKDGYYLVGSFSNWTVTDEAYLFSANPASDGEYMLSTILTAGDSIKAVKVENGAISTWYPSGTGDEYVVDAAHAGNVTIYFKSTSQADWSAFGGYMYIDNGSTPDVPTEAPTDAPADTVTVYFTDALNWGSVNVYYWPNGGAWPGSAAEKYEVNGYSQQVYKATIPASVDGLIFNGGGKQTVDITSGITDGAQWYTVNTTDASGHYNVALVGDEPTPTEAPTPSSNDVVFEPGDAGAGSPAWFAWVYNGSKADQWIQGTTDGSGNVTFPGAGDFGGMVIVRMPTGSTSGAWSGYWNRTGDITIQKGKTLYFTGWNNDYFNTAWK
jgi:cell division septation protein DedD